MHFGVTIVNSFLASAIALWGVVYLIVFMGLALPGIAVTVRRMHDVDRSGWWWWFPVINIVFLVKRGSPETNSYGPPA